jgi:hypothetical protein
MKPKEVFHKRYLRLTIYRTCLKPSVPRTSSATAPYSRRLCPADEQCRSGRRKGGGLEGLSWYWVTFGSLEHDLLNIYGTDSAFMLEALNHYTRLDGNRVTLQQGGAHRPE